MYAVIVLNSEEAILNAESIVKFLDNKEDALSAFIIEKENIKSFLGIENDTDPRIRENTETKFSVEDNDRIYAGKVQLVEIEKLPVTIITHF